MTVSRRDPDGASGLCVQAVIDRDGARVSLELHGLTPEQAERIAGIATRQLPLAQEGHPNEKELNEHA
jgi:hypothetical protein